MESFSFALNASLRVKG